jgi:hypothetical protein
MPQPSSFPSQSTDGLNASSQSEAASTFIVNHIQPPSKTVRQSSSNRTSHLDHFAKEYQQKRAVRANIGIFAKGSGCTQSTNRTDFVCEGFDAYAEPVVVERRMNKHEIHMMDKIVSSSSAPRQFKSFKAGSQIQSVYGNGPSSRKISQPSSNDSVGRTEPVKYKQIGDVSGLGPSGIFVSNIVSKLAVYIFILIA